MNKILCLMAAMSLSFCAFGCVTNGLECDENTFENICLDDTTVEICTYGERAQLKCVSKMVCEGGATKKGAGCVPSN